MLYRSVSISAGGFVLGEVFHFTGCLCETLPGVSFEGSFATPIGCFVLGVV